MSPAETEALTLSLSVAARSVVFSLPFALLVAWLLTRTRFGNWIYASGGDANAARNVGVPVARTKITLFVMTALAAALFAVIQVLVTGSAATTSRRTGVGELATASITRSWKNSALAKNNGASQRNSTSPGIRRAPG